MVPRCVLASTRSPRSARERRYGPFHTGGAGTGLSEIAKRLGTVRASVY